ncbi:hypothetical protein CAEBREN_25892 [Caenorhabditis brenneri]|uniref:Uncharacterized protein n=1 Tax=Caenorhabditis brenneri TaxID=135651 RepID=G0NZ17_CAEBE|nr:hypothetical protein CAEBREN_25892 [Caenorhabditis brenneri]
MRMDYDVEAFCLVEVVMVDLMIQNYFRKFNLATPSLTRCCLLFTVSSSLQRDIGLRRSKARSETNCKDHLRMEKKKLMNTVCKRKKVVSMCVCVHAMTMEGSCSLL